MNNRMKAKHAAREAWRIWHTHAIKCVGFSVYVDTNECVYLSPDYGYTVTMNLRGHVLKIERHD